MYFSVQLLATLQANQFHNDQAFHDNAAHFADKFGGSK